MVARNMDWIDRLSFLGVGIALVCVGYGLYQIPQRVRLRADVSLQLPIDDWIPFRPVWTWVYLMAYYPFLGVLIFLVPSWSEFAILAANFLVMLGVHIAISLALPVRVPDDWRIRSPYSTVSLWMLGRVQHIDKGGNCFPSMHVAIAVLSTFHLLRLVEVAVPVEAMIWCFPCLIAASTVFTKQHYFADVPAGAFLGGLACAFYHIL